MSRSLCEALARVELGPAEAGRLAVAGPRLELRRAWPRGAGRLLLEYRAEGGGLLPGQWFADAARAAEVAAGTDRAAEGGGGACLLRPVDGAPGGFLLLQSGGADRRLPGLAGLLARPGAALLVHRPERRAVVRLDGPDGPRYAKAAPPERLAALLDAAGAAREIAGAAFAVPEALEVDRRAGVVVWSALGGRPIYELLDRPELPRLMRAAGRALRALHAAPAPERCHGPAEEVAVLEGWAERAGWADPRLREPIAAALGPVTAALSEPPEPAAAIHRDLYDKQIFIAAGGEVGLLDFDTLAGGEPALDLGNALAHLELRALQGRVSAETAARASEALLEGYRPGGATLRRLPVYRAAARLRLACVYTFRPPWSALAPALLGRRAA